MNMMNTMYVATLVEQIDLSAFTTISNTTFETKVKNSEVTQRYFLKEEDARRWIQNTSLISRVSSREAGSNPTWEKEMFFDSTGMFAEYGLVTGLAVGDDGEVAVFNEVSSHPDLKFCSYFV